MNIDKSINSAFEYYRKNNLEEAEILCRKILQKKPGNVRAIYLLGIVQYRLGKYDSAIDYLKKAVQMNKADADGYYNLGRAYHKKRQFDEAEACYEKVLRINPHSSDSYINLGKICHERGQIEKAATYYKKALEINPASAGVHFNIAIALQDKGEIDEALLSYQKAIRLSPSYAEAYNNAGYIFLKKKKFDEAVPVLQKAIQLKPDMPDAYNNLGCVLYEKKQFEDAVSCYRKALEINPALPDAYFNMGNIAYERGLQSDAIGYYQKAAQLNPENADVYNNMGNAFKEKGLLDKAVMYYRDALEKEPKNHITYSNILLSMNYDPHYDAGTIFSEHLAFSKKYAEPLFPSIFPFSNDRTPDRRLKIGYVSPDFRRQSVGFFIEPVLASHNHSDFEIYCYSNLPAHDDMTERMQTYADFWTNIADMTDDSVAELVREHKIDVLVDLAGHTGYNRIILFAMKPAPVQIAWIGYPNTTGLSAVDYRIVDNFTDPQGLTEKYNTEKLMRMPDSFLCYRPDPNSPDITESPFLSAGHITFGSFNLYTKVTPEVLSVWSEILKELPDAHLVMKSKVFADKDTCNHVSDMFSQLGISEKRIDLLSFAPSFHNHLDLYNKVDIALDTFPYNGTTTTYEALWMGVPVIALEGATHVSRVGISALSNIGLTEYIAGTTEEYVRIAVRLAQDIEKLRFLRKTLRDMMMKSPVTDAIKFTGNLENIYRKIWQDWRNSV